MPETPAAAPTRAGAFLLLAAIMVAAACAIVYELLIGSTSSYFLGNSVEQYSLTIGFFLFAMGIGSWLSRLMHEHLLARFIALEIWLGTPLICRPCCRYPMMNVAMTVPSTDPLPP